MNERIEYLQKKARELTTSPGVYLMKDRTGKVIYVGKAKVLTQPGAQLFPHRSQTRRKGPQDGGKCLRL